MKKPLSTQPLKKRATYHNPAIGAASATYKYAKPTAPNPPLVSPQMGIPSPGL
jgi:hypothetical protein